MIIKVKEARLDGGIDKNNRKGRRLGKKKREYLSTTTLNTQGEEEQEQEKKKKNVCTSTMIQRTASPHPHGMFHRTIEL